MEKDKLIELILKEVEKQLKAEKSEIFLVEKDPLLETVLSKDFIFSENAKKVVVPSLSIPEFVALAQGSFITQKTEFILNSLFENKDVFLIEEGILWREKNNNTTLTSLYLKYENELRRFGIKFVKRIELLDFIKEKKVYLNKRVITSRELKKFEDCKNCHIIIPNNAFITESANKFIENNNIVLIKE